MTTLIALSPPITESSGAKRPLTVVGADGPPWPDDPTGPIQGGYYFRQDIAVQEWVIKHNLGTFPDVTVQDTIGMQITGLVTWVSIYELTIRFDGPVAGKASLAAETNVSKAPPQIEAA